LLARQQRECCLRFPTMTQLDVTRKRGDGERGKKRKKGMRVDADSFHDL